MANTLAKFKKYTDKLDEVYQNAAVTSILDGDGRSEEHTSELQSLA